MLRNAAASISIGLYAGSLDHLGPAPELAADKGAELLLRHAAVVRAVAGPQGLDVFGAPQALDFIDDARLHLGGRAPGRPPARPGGRGGVAESIRALRGPFLICVADEPRPSNIMSTLPAIKSCSAGPAPR